MTIIELLSKKLAPPEDVYGRFIDKSPGSKYKNGTRIVLSTFLAKDLTKQFMLQTSGNVSRQRRTTIQKNSLVNIFFQFFIYCRICTSKKS
jgi:hypothetical protein